jgi:carbonic anhydrase
MNDIIFNTLIVLGSVTVSLALAYAVSRHTLAKSEAPAEYVVPASTTTKELRDGMSAEEILDVLMRGNRRFVDNEKANVDHIHHQRETAQGQHPYAVILSCMDSRTSAEIIFDQKLGDVFNIRIAGNFVNPTILGSIEYATKVAGAKLVMVVGHTSCGAIKGACDFVELGNLTKVIEELTPSVRKTAYYGIRNSGNPKFVDAVCKTHVHDAIEEIRAESGILAEMERNNEILIVGGIHDIETGIVSIL